jgi:hypothetical protein
LFTTSQTLTCVYLKALLEADGASGGKVKVFCSPHRRTRETLDGVLSAIPDFDNIWRVGETTFDPLLREIDRGFFKQSLETVRVRLHA